MFCVRFVHTCFDAAELDPAAIVKHSQSDAADESQCAPVNMSWNPAKGHDVQQGHGPGTVPCMLSIFETKREWILQPLQCFELRYTIGEQQKCCKTHSFETMIFLSCFNPPRVFFSSLRWLADLPGFMPHVQMLAEHDSALVFSTEVSFPWLFLATSLPKVPKPQVLYGSVVLWVFSPKSILWLTAQWFSLRALNSQPMLCNHQCEYDWICDLFGGESLKQLTLLDHATSSASYFPISAMSFLDFVQGALTSTHVHRIKER